MKPDEILAGCVMVIVLPFVLLWDLFVNLTGWLRRG